MKMRKSGPRLPMARRRSTKIVLDRRKICIWAKEPREWRGCWRSEGGMAMVNHRRRRRPNVSWSVRAASIRREVHIRVFSFELALARGSPHVSLVAAGECFVYRCSASSCIQRGETRRPRTTYACKRSPIRSFIPFFFLRHFAELRPCCLLLCCTDERRVVCAFICHIIFGSEFFAGAKDSY